MKRKIVLSISALLIVAEIGFSAAIFTAGERQITASLARVIALVRELSRPIPKIELPRQIIRPFVYSAISTRDD